jgi:hypothetical protein
LNVDSVQERDQRQERQIDIEAGRACQREKAVALTRPAAAPDLAYKAAIVRLPAHGCARGRETAAPDAL